MNSPLLSVQDIHTSYGAAPALFGVSLQIQRGQAVSLLGRNGMGRSTTIRTIMGMLPLQGGSIVFDGHRLGHQRTYRVASLGIGLVPEGRQIFSTLSVRENLIATARGNGPWTLEAIYELFPRLEERSDNLGSQLSGGEQQMLAIGRALMTHPKLLILDEATEGLAPLIREEIWATVRRLRDLSQSILIVDKNLPVLMDLCDHHYVLERGKTVWDGDSAALKANMEQVQQYMSL
ncbi:ABC transporter ATP-binding protein [Pusillimonas sp. CC-YST705]|uniref:ABC transporter ATP-binding protein n=1 Tax=Mesopusillimonas faecipullorum TaxID=2755040 RepID=A0ABS8CFP8_9BURK|nr:ABC transporter ATP-binding protein [Mesopusillimonas faecipullorum]MCB5364865.1 ABC transporter ATP-binding protein [Mesopusillimonas faecipullorum]